MWVLPADHHIAQENALKESFHQSLALADQNYLVTFGIRPTRPDTGYGYIQVGKKLAESAAHEAAAFIEKPDFEKACALLNAGGHG